MKAGRIIGVIVLAAMLAGMVLGVACTEEQSEQGPTMTFDRVGTKGATVFITLVSPSIDEVSADDMADRLRDDWQDERFPGVPAGQVFVMVFDNKEAPQEWLAVWDRLATMSDEEWATHEAQIFPHFIAQYERNTSTGLHQVEFYSRDVDWDVVRTIKFYVSPTQTDTTAPVISAVGISGVTNRSATISWTTDEPATSVIEYGLSTSSYSSSTSLDSSLVYSHSVRVTGLAQNTTYHCRAVSQDAHGNSTSSGDYSFVTFPLSTTPNDANTASQLQAFLEQNFATLNTSLGPTTFSFDIWPNTSILISYDYAIRVGYDHSFFSDLQYSNQISTEMNHIVCQELKDHQERLAKAVINRMPGKMFQGGYFYSWYEYPLIYEGYHDIRYYSWVNYQPFFADYEDAEVTGFTWWPDVDDTLTR
jgi:hypothetical protein